MAKETQKLTKEQMEDFRKIQKQLQEDPRLMEGMRQLVGGKEYQRALKMKKPGEKLTNISEGIDDIFFLSGTPAGRQQLRMKKLQKEQLEALKSLTASQVIATEHENKSSADDDTKEELTDEEQAELDAIQKQYEDEEELKAEEDVDKPSRLDPVDGSLRTGHIIGIVIIIILCIVAVIVVTSASK